MPAVDSGLLAAVIVAGGVTLVVAIVMTIVSQYRARRLTTTRGALSVTLGVGVMVLAGLGVVALSPVAAQAATTPVSSVSSGTSSSGTNSSGTIAVDLQLPTK